MSFQYLQLYQYFLGKQEQVEEAGETPVSSNQHLPISYTHFLDSNLAFGSESVLPITNSIFVGGPSWIQQLASSHNSSLDNLAAANSNNRLSLESLLAVEVESRLNNIEHVLSIQNQTSAPLSYLLQIQNGLRFQASNLSSILSGDKFELSYIAALNSASVLGLSHNIGLSLSKSAPLSFLSALNSGQFINLESELFLGQDHTLNVSHLAKLGINTTNPLDVLMAQPISNEVPISWLILGASAFNTIEHLRLEWLLSMETNLDSNVEYINPLSSNNFFSASHTLSAGSNQTISLSNRAALGLGKPILLENILLINNGILVPLSYIGCLQNIDNSIPLESLLKAEVHNTAAVEHLKKTDIELATSLEYISGQVGKLSAVPLSWLSKVSRTDTIAISSLLELALGQVILLEHDDIFESVSSSLSVSISWLSELAADNNIKISYQGTSTAAKILTWILSSQNTNWIVPNNLTTWIIPRSNSDWTL